MKNFISKFREIILKFKEYMLRLSYQIPSYKIPAPQFRLVMHLNAKKSNETRCSSTNQMQKRCIDTSNHLPGLGVDEIEDLILNASELDEVKAPCRKLSALETINLALQDRSTTLAEAKTWFNAVMGKHSNTRHSIGQNAGGFENANFESVVLKLQNEKQETLNGAENLTLKTTDNKWPDR